MKKTGQIPYTWEEIELQVRQNIVAMADVLAVYGPTDSSALLDLFLGCDTSKIETDNITSEQLAGLDLSNHGIFRLTKVAYDYAYQLEGAENATGDDWYEVGGLLGNSYAQTDRHGEPAPLYDRADEPLRRVLETFFARWDLNNHSGAMTVRRLSLLSNMSTQAVRNSLSKDGLKLELRVSGRDDDNSFELNASDALEWLSKRRGYIPNRLDIQMRDPTIAAAELLNSIDLDFVEVVARLTKVPLQPLEKLPQVTRKPAQWVSDLLAGKSVEIDLGAIAAIGAALGADPAKFTGRAVEHLMRVNSGSAPSVN